VVVAMGGWNAVAVARAVELLWIVGDWWWQCQGCWRYSVCRLAVVVEWRSSGGGGGSGVAVAMAHQLKVSYFSAYLLFFLAVASKQRALTVSIC
jgi:hypothetical protein